MIIKGITDEDFVNYKLPSMFIVMPNCSFKCDWENGSPVCQNSVLALQPAHDVSHEYLVKRYLRNEISHAIVLGGLEPFDSFDDVVALVRYARETWFHVDDGSLAYVKTHCYDDIVIYTGYNKDEITDKIDILKQYPNVVVKYGRYIPNQQPHYDPVLGVYLASDNQYAERIS